MAELISDKYRKWEAECDDRFNRLKTNEEELNRIFIDIYGLGAGLSPEVAEKDITVRRAELQRDIRSLISYAVGCWFGRYSVDCEGLCCTGGELDPQKYSTIIPVADNIIPVCGAEPNNSLTARIIEFVSAVYGTETLEENLAFIAEALGGGGAPRVVIEQYLVRDLYRDHCRIYRKRPIYWLFSSGRKRGFRCLVYAHRFNADTPGLMLESYVQPAAERYREQLRALGEEVERSSNSQKQTLKRQYERLAARLEETCGFAQRLKALADDPVQFDLNDGIKANYAKLESVLEKIY